MTLLPVIMLIRREILRFARERSRMLGVIVSPILFWLVIGSGLNRSFQQMEGIPEMNFLEYFFPGSVVLIVLFAAIFSSISVIEDQREGFMQSVLVAPVPRASIALGKITGIAILATLQGTIFLLAAPIVLPEVTTGSMILAVLVLVVLAFALSSLGFLIAWSMDSTQGFHLVMNLLLVPMWMVSGALFPASGASGWIMVLMQWNPLTYGVAAVRGSLYGLQPQYLHDLPGFGMSLAVLCAFAAAAGFLAHMRVGRRDRGARISNGEIQK